MRCPFGRTKKRRDESARVAGELTRWPDKGSTRTVNLLEVALRAQDGCDRGPRNNRSIHGMLWFVNSVFSDLGGDIAAQLLQVNEAIGYVVIDIDAEYCAPALTRLRELDGALRCRVLFCVAARRLMSALPAAPNASRIPCFRFQRRRCAPAPVRLLAASLSLAFVPTSGATADPAPPGPVANAASPVTAFEQIWNLTRDQIYPARLVATRFDSATYHRLREQVSALDSVEALPDVVNPFLDSLGVSHTQLYPRHSLEYAFFRSLFSTRDPNQPPFSHLGVQLLDHAGRWHVRETLDGFPAALAGLERGDELLTIDGEPFDPRLMCDGGERRGEKPHLLEVLRRGADRITVEVRCVRQNPHASMHQAIGNSSRVLTVGNHTVGYLRLWTGTGPGGLEIYLAAIASLAQTDAMILDLRGGFGGAWYEHLDPFFADRQGFFTFTVIDRDGSTIYHPEPHETEAPYEGPMAVLINEGTRSGKEAVAYQFKNSGRAALIGSRTRGAFSAGKGLFLEDRMPLVYYLAVAEYRLDGHRIEGVGVSPDIPVPYPVTGAGQAEPGETARYEAEDPQVAAALEYLGALLTRPTSKSRPLIPLGAPENPRPVAGGAVQGEAGRFVHDQPP